mgnify:FL=1
MPVVKASLHLFGGDTVVVHCSNKSHIHLMSDNSATGKPEADILSVEDKQSAYVTGPYSGKWKVLIDSHSKSLEHSISYVAA